MKLTKKLEAEVLKVYKAYWDAYFSGDMKTFASFLDDEIIIIGTAVSEIFNSKKETLKFYKATADQLVGKAQFRKRHITVHALNENILINEHCDLYILMEKKWTFYGNIRASAILKHTKTGWKLVHQHGSFPDMRAEEGEQLAAEKIKAENIQLRDAVKRRTIELEEKNRELEIESALERVRAVAMAMNKAADMMDVCKTISSELKGLGVKEIRNVMTAIFYKDRGKYMNYQYYVKHRKAIVTDSSYTGHKIDKAFAAKMLKGKGSVSIAHIKGNQKVREWVAFQKTINVFIDKYLYTASSLSYYWYSLGPVALGISTYHPLTEEGTTLFKRFLKVFGLAYRRYLDIEKAEAQARESQIQLALERVRARTMAMQKSNELPETSYLLFQQVKELGLTAVQNSIGIVNEDAGFVELSTTVQGHHLPHTLNVPINDPYVMAKAVAAWKAKSKSLKLEFAGQELKNYNEHRNSFFETKVNFPEDRWIVNIIFFSKGWLSFSCNEDISDETFDLLKRFAAVFEQTYTRFNDLKQAEEQARESQIQLALERVRARTMAMQHSDELKDAAALLFQQVKALGVPAYSCGYNIWEKDETTFTSWMSTQDGSDFNAVQNIPLTEDANFIRFAESRERGEQFFVLELRGEKMQQHYEYLKTIPAFKAYFDHAISVGFDLPETQIHHLANFSQGNLLFITLEPCPEFHGVFKRFAAVFEQTYTRFLDLQKAEAQAREARIENALEKVRSRTMAMQRSEELPEAANNLFLQVQALEIPAWSAGYCIWDEDKKGITFWMSSEGVMQPSAHAPCTEDPSFIHMREAYERGDAFHVEELGGEALVTHYNYMRTLPVVGEILDSIIAAGHPLPVFQIFHCVYFSQGFLLFITYEKVPEAHIIFKRFTNVFEQTYTRFLDLQKAEAQVREAKIEAALEKVRSRTMAMQRSAELAEVATVLFQQVKALGVPQWTCGFGIFEIDDKEFIWYQGSEDGDILPPCKIPLTEHPVFIQFNESRKRNDGLYIYEKTGEMQADHYKYMLSLPVLGKLLQDRLDAGIQFPTFQIDHIVNFSHGNLVFITYEHFPEMHDIFKRFAKVFDQTYTRFLDLQKAEAQAREAVKQASVDRVRAEIASMRTTSDLERITPLIWNELKTLGVPFIRCGVFIIDEEQQQVHTFLSTPDGKANASFTSAISTVSIITEALPYWRRKEMYKAHWDEATFIEQTKHLVEQGAVSSTNTYLTENRPKNLYLHLLPFLQGILYVGNETPLSDDELQLVQNLADAFAIAYARYEDFNKLELAKEQIENTLVDLKQTQAQLVQSEKMASLGELTAGIAHEIQNPLNFVNNFSEVNKELLAEMNEEIEKGNMEEVKALAKDVIDNEEKINHHGKRADAIVKGMLQHSRSSSGVKEPSDINVLADEYLRLAYHGLRAKDKSFNATMKTDFDETIGKIDIVPQDVGRSVLNLITNAFYAVSEKKKQSAEGYEPTVTVTTKRINGKIEIRVADNGNGIPQKVLDKIFQPFFTTKPTGQGTGLGLSLSYDIVKAHNGELKVETNEGKGSEFIIFLPANN
ncbi:MAG TPA: ATP-binding protein [Chitinophagaceae bacterium]|nr:ATP-binding protein [Chitinophagaceae bacterium]